MIWGIGLRRLGWVCGGVWGLVVVCLFDVEPYGRPRLKVTPRCPRTFDKQVYSSAPVRDLNHCGFDREFFC